MVSSWTTSHVAVRGSASMTLATELLILKALVSFAKLLEPPLHCTFLTVPGPTALLILRVVSATLQPILNLNKKSFKFAFCLKSFL